MSWLASVLASCVVDPRFTSRLDTIKHYQLGICCHDYLARNKDNVSRATWLQAICCFRDIAIEKSKLTSSNLTRSYYDIADTVPSYLSNNYPLTLYSPTHSIFTHSLYIHPLTLYSSTHSILTHSLYIHPFTLYSPTQSIFTHSLYIQSTKFIGRVNKKLARNLNNQFINTIYILLQIQLIYEP